MKFLNVRMPHQGRARRRRTVVACLTVSAVFVSVAMGAGSTPLPAPPASSSAPPPFLIPAPLKRLVRAGRELRADDFDLQGRLGRGKPVALVFWTMQNPIADAALVDFAHAFAAEAPAVEWFVVAGKSAEQRTESVWEELQFLGLPASTPVLLDDGFVLAKKLDAGELPDVRLFDAAGQPVASKLRSLRQRVSWSTEPYDAAELVRRLGQGIPIAPLREPARWYPATELVGRCAPAFTLPDAATRRDTRFSGRSSSGLPTLLMFWSPTCKHCQKEIPRLVRNWYELPGRYDVVSVALGKGEGASAPARRKHVTDYVGANNILWPVLDDSSGLAATLYGVVSTPTTFLVSPSGEVVQVWLYPHENLDAAIEKALPSLGAPRGSCAPAVAERGRRASLSMIDPEGREVSLDSLVDRPTIVHLWATWCSPCRTELPKLLDFGETIEKGGGRLVILSVEDGSAKDAIDAFGKSLGRPFRSFLSPRGELADRERLDYSLPRTFLVRGGRIVKTYLGAQSWSDPDFRENVRTLLQLPEPPPAAR